MSAQFLKARVKRKTVPKIYRLIAPFHDGLALVVEKKARQFQIEHARIKDGEDILEVGVGTGLSFKTIVQLNTGGSNTGLDITPAMLARAEKRLTGHRNSSTTLMLGDAFDLPFPDEQFDLVFNSYMFDLLSEPDMVLVLREFARVLRPGGRLSLNYMTPGETHLEKLWDTIYRIHPFLLGGCRGVSAMPYLENAGFGDIEMTRISYRTFPSEVISAKVRK